MSYVYQEYPKMLVHPDTGEQVIVQNHTEEEAQLTAWPEQTNISAPGPDSARRIPETAETPEEQEDA